MAGISTGVSLLSAANTLQIEDGLVRWFEFEGSEISSLGSSSYDWVGLHGGLENPEDFVLEPTGGKIGAGYLASTQFDPFSGSFLALRGGSSSLGSGASGTIGGWVKEYINGSPSVAATIQSAALCLLNTSFNSSAAVGDIGLAVSGTTGSTKTFSFVGGGGSGSTTGSLSGWTFFSYSFDFSDTSAGADGTQYFSINNGTVYSKALPAKGIFTYLQGVPYVDYSWNTVSNSHQHVFGMAVDGIFIYNKKLNSDQIAHLYNSGAGRSFGSL